MSESHSHIELRQVELQLYNPFFYRGIVSKVHSGRFIVEKQCDNKSKGQRSYPIRLPLFPSKVRIPKISIKTIRGKA